MFWSFVYLIVRLVLRTFMPRDELDRSTEAEILVLRHELKILRRQNSRPRLEPKDRLLLAALSKILDRRRWSAFLVTPSTVLRWHRQLVKRKWTYRARRQGRPGTPEQVRELIVAMAKDNRSWGYLRIKGELRKVKIYVSATTVRNILKGEGLRPSSSRKDPNWAQFIRAQADGIVACDFLTVETVLLRTYTCCFSST